MTQEQLDQELLFHCSITGYLQGVKYPIKEGANVNVTTKDGSTPLHLAARKGNIELFKLLIKEGANPTAENQYGFTPLMEAQFCFIEFLKTIEQAMKEEA